MTLQESTGTPQQSAEAGPSRLADASTSEKQRSPRAQQPPASSPDDKPPPPAILVPLLDAIDSCLASMQAWSDRMNEKNAQKRKARLKRRRTGGAGNDSDDEDGEDDEDETDPGTIPDPVLKRKGMILLVMIILAWVYAVYVWRLCVPAIREAVAADSHPVRLASRPTGIGLLVAFNVIWLMTIWTYLKAITTGPGHVKDVVTKSACPPTEEEDWRQNNFGGPYLGPETGDHAADPDVESRRGAVDRPNTAVTASSATAASSLTQPAQRRERNASTEALHDATDGEASSSSPSSSTTTTAAGVTADAPDRAPGGDEHPIDPSLPASIGPIGAGLLAGKKEEAQLETEINRQPQLQQDGQIDYASLPRLATIDDSFDQTQTIRPPANESNYNHTQSQPLPPHAPPSRMPPSPDYAPMHPHNRYCYRCEHVKTPRSHHCRHCGTCVLKMDHHCAWVGNCVGARNHKFFYNFVLWVTILEIFVLTSMGILFTRGAQNQAGYQQWTVDGFLISLFPICFLFLLFTFPLLVTHTYLLTRNLTTIEHLAFTRQARREEVLLNKWIEDLPLDSEENGYHSRNKGLWVLRKKYRVKKGWERDWGALRWETNLWKVEELDDESRGQRRRRGEKDVEKVGQQQQSGSRQWKRNSMARQMMLNWTQSMGKSWLGWVLPIGKTHDGVEYPLNPRHGPMGQWRRRELWPEELR